MHRTTAWPLALMYAALIGYASLYPFVGWRDSGVQVWDFLSAPPPKYWTGFDLIINVVGYMPLGALLALTALRSGFGRYPVLLPVLCAVLLSCFLETVQNYLPARVASKEDFFLNAFGAWAGAVAALVLERLGAVDRWSQVRARWFVEHSRGGIALLLAWPLALLFPAAVPFGVGHVWQRAQHHVSTWLADTPFVAWLPVPDTALLPLAPVAEVVCVVLGLLIPCLLGFCIVQARLRRLQLVIGIMACGVSVSALSSALSWGPVHAWAWLDGPTQIGIAVAMLLAVSLIRMPWRACAALALLALGLYLSILNQSPESPYVSAILQTWEQGRFIRFHGLAQWLGWLWPYAAAVYLLSEIGQADLET